MCDWPFNCKSNPTPSPDAESDAEPASAVAIPTNRSQRWSRTCLWSRICFTISFYRYGFTESAGNFQLNNFNRGGQGSDAIRANIQASGSCNANFATPPDGSTPTMNMYTCNLATPLRDTGMDNGVILHEITHGVSNRLTGGASNVWCLSGDQSGGMETRGTNKAVGAYSFNMINGIRSYAYSTSLTTNPLRFSDIANRPGQVHFIGTVWSSILYEVYWNMIEVVQAESVNNNNRFRCAIWRGFAKRGLGVNAPAGASFNNFDVPSGC
ncbi:Fungalysin metallopeptidase-domain-containing protein [Chytridium lagenaria]|nr:Fungalysin metallopeptidase-domain-containing protein [Chytridium lagenaria]